MARISTYNKDISPSLKDKVIGSNFGGSETYNYPLKDIGELFANLGVSSTPGQLVFEFQSDLTGGRREGTLSFSAGGGINTLFSDITTFKLSGKGSSLKNISDYINVLQGRRVILAQVDDINNFGIYTLASRAQDPVETEFYDIGLEYIQGHGALEEGKYYSIISFPMDILDTSDLTYTHVQSVAQTETTVVHNLNKIPSVTVVNNQGYEVETDVKHIDLNTTQILTGASFSFTAYFN